MKTEGKVEETFGKMFLVFGGKKVYDRCVTESGKQIGDNTERRLP